MAVQDQKEGATSNTFGAAACRSSNFGGEADGGVELKEIYSFGNDHTPKVRKPYTITKQREKWTDEEHQRFLEALKLYGRGWRQIEEHVGTKTAVQIRSHAQKFFSKVAKESSSGAEGSIKSIEIPPPRPKRKPVHPYPRKSVDAPKRTSIKSEASASPKQLAVEKERQSPTSVLSAVNSDTLGSAVTEQHGGCHSPTSCTTEIHSNSCAPVEKENDSLTSNSPAGKEKGSFTCLQLSAISNLENLSLMKSNSGSKDTACSKVDDNLAASHTNIKLFGTTLALVGTQREQPSDGDNVSSIALRFVEENDNPKREKPAETASTEQLDTELSLGIAARNSNKIPSLSSICSMGLKLDSAQANCGRSSPWWALYQCPPFVYPPLYNQGLVQIPTGSPAGEPMKEKEKSCTGSNSGAVSEVENEKNLDAVDSRCQQAYLELKPVPVRCTKGFVPYKRCLAERDIKSSVTDLEEREGQRARVCS